MGYPAITDTFIQESFLERTNGELTAAHRVVVSVFALRYAETRRVSPPLARYIPIKTGITIGALFVRVKRKPATVSESAFLT